MAICMINFYLYFKYNIDCKYKYEIKDGLQREHIQRNMSQSAI